MNNNWQALLAYLPPAGGPGDADPAERSPGCPPVAELLLLALCEARDRGWLADVPAPEPPPLGPPGRPPSGVRMSLLELLQGRGPRGRVLKNVTVLPSTPVPADDQAGWEKKCREFGKVAA